MTEIIIHAVHEEERSEKMQEDELMELLDNLGGTCSRLKKSYPVVWGLLKRQYFLSDYSSENKALPKDLFEKKVSLEIEIRNREKNRK